MNIKGLVSAAFVMMVALAGCVTPESEIADIAEEEEIDLDPTLETQSGGCSPSGLTCIILCGGGGACHPEEAGPITVWYCGDC